MDSQTCERPSASIDELAIIRLQRAFRARLNRVRRDQRAVAEADGAIGAIERLCEEARASPSGVALLDEHPRAQRAEMLERSIRRLQRLFRTKRAQKTQAEHPRCSGGGSRKSSRSSRPAAARASTSSASAAVPDSCECDDSGADEPQCDPLLRAVHLLQRAYRNRNHRTTRGDSPRKQLVGTPVSHAPSEPLADARPCHSRPRSAHATDTRVPRSHTRRDIAAGAPCTEDDLCEIGSDFDLGDSEPKLERSVLRLQRLYRAYRRARAVAAAQAAAAAARAERAVRQLQRSFRKRKLHELIGEGRARRVESTIRVLQRKFRARRRARALRAEHSALACGDRGSSAKFAADRQQAHAEAERIRRLLARRFVARASEEDSDRSSSRRSGDGARCRALTSDHSSAEGETDLSSAPHESRPNDRAAPGDRAEERRRESAVVEIQLRFGLRRLERLLESLPSSDESAMTEEERLDALGPLDRPLPFEAFRADACGRSFRNRETSLGIVAGLEELRSAARVLDSRGSSVCSWAIGQSVDAFARCRSRRVPTPDRKRLYVQPVITTDHVHIQEVIDRMQGILRAFFDPLEVVICSPVATSGEPPRSDAEPRALARLFDSEGVTAAQPAPTDAHPVRTERAGEGNRSTTVSGTQVLLALRARIPPDAFAVFAVTDAELRCDHGSTDTGAESAVFGLASRTGRVGVCSTAHLRDTADPLVTLRRVVRCAIHELCHVLGMRHCPYYQCLMNATRSDVREHDARPSELCPVCARKLQLSLGFRFMDWFVALARAWGGAGLESERAAARARAWGAAGRLASDSVPQ